MTVSLREITAGTVRRITDLAVTPDQQRFVASNAVSLAQALFSPEAFYLGCGFRHTGRAEDGEIVLELPLRQDRSRP
jgi:hypothetical protein